MCVFSQMKDIKHIRRDFHLVAWVMPQGSDLGVPWGVGWSKKIFSSEIQPDLVCELLTSMAHETAQFFWSPPPGALRRDQKVKHHKISITKSISKIFKQNFVCLLTNERYKTYQTGFSFRRLDHAPGVALGGTMGGWVVPKFFFQKFNQIWCVSCLHQWHMQQHNFFCSPPPGALGSGQKVKYH